MAGGFCQETGMEPQAPPVGEQETKPRWWTIGYRLFSLLVLVLLAWSFIGTPEDRTVTVLESSALSEPDLIEAGMAIQSELAKGAPDAPAVLFQNVRRGRATIILRCRFVSQQPSDGSGVTSCGFGIPERGEPPPAGRFGKPSLPQSAGCKIPAALCCGL